MIVDAHQHFWQVGHFDYPWMNPEVEVLYQDYLPSQVEPILKECDVAKSVLVQASNSLAETYWLLSLAERHPFIAGVVGWVDVRHPEMEQELEVLTANPKFKGVRHLVESEPADDWLIQPSVLKGLQVLEKHHVSYDLLVHTRHLKHVKTVAEACPSLRLVVDHMAKPPIASGEIADWASALKEVAAYPNVWCKLSGLVTEANWTSWTTEDLRPYVERALEFFGPKRMMFGSDGPVCLLAGSYAQVLEAFQWLLADLAEEDRNRIFSGNATVFYKFLGEADLAWAPSP
ncbi:MAG: amidohydrolase family protein [Pyrinomonadaceae bacterium]|nr:amidohydrolase family protein [Pyrinomonadaceae bacterium]